MNKSKLIVRLILSAFLLCGVYTETGIWTTICCSLAVLAVEINGFRLIN